MLIVATQKNVRQSPRKVRLVANEVKDLGLEKAMRQLAVIERRSSLVILKVVKQAVANAMNNHQLGFDELRLASIQVTPGPTYKRWRAVSRGRAHEILKRTCHVRVELETQQSVMNQPIDKPATAVAPKKETKAQAESAPKKKAVQKKAELPEPSMSMTREELNGLAEQYGVESPESLPRKQAVVDAIEAQNK